MRNSAEILLAICIGLAVIQTAESCRSGNASEISSAASINIKASRTSDDAGIVRPLSIPSTGEQAMAYMKESGHWSNYSKGILPRMADDVPDYACRILGSGHDGFLVVDKDRMEVIRFDRYGVELEAFGMACAKNYGTKHKKSDSRTPEGFFSVKRIHNSTEWHYVDDNGVRSDKKGEFGPRFIRLNIPGTSQIGIHGTSAPTSIGGRRSHGCIRLTNENILKLVESVDSGMPVIITPAIKDMIVNREEGVDIPSVSTVPGKPRLILEEKYMSDL